jgi:predicted TIM-barrel fold metal-dependent hydrolase
MLPRMSEQALDPERRICDPHHHLYPEGSPVHARYLVDDLKRDLALGHNVVRTCYIETSGSVYREGGPVRLQPVGEPEWVMTMASGGLMQGIIPYADLMLADGVGEVLDEHVKAAGDRFRGIRFRGMVLGQPDPPYDFLAEPAFRAGASVLQRRGLVLEIFITFDLIRSLADFARSAPDLPIVLDHLGVPLIVGEWEGRRDEVLEQWRASLRELATCGNVFMKVGGIGMSFVTDASQFSSPPTSEEIAAHWGPEVRFAVEQFGTKRCMFESNFPFDDHLCDYATLWNTFKRIAADASETEKADLFHDTAVRFYGLPA